jgi:hypothetical protein
MMGDTESTALQHEMGQEYQPVMMNEESIGGMVTGRGKPKYLKRNLPLHHLTTWTVLRLPKHLH